MQKMAFTIAVLVVATAVISLRGNGKEQRQASNFAEISVNRSLHVPWKSGTEFVMQWNDACKKLLFDGYPICHAKPKVHDVWCGGGRVQIVEAVDVVVSSVPASDRPDEYSFDSQCIGGLAASCAPARHDGLIHFGMEWNAAEDRSVPDNIEPDVPELSWVLIAVDCFAR